MMSCPVSAEWKAVPAGWTSDEPGYWCNEQDGRDTLTAIRTYKQQAQAWESAYNELLTEVRTSNEAFALKLKQLEDSFNSERRVNQRNMLIYSLVAFGIGFVAGR